MNDQPDTWREWSRHVLAELKRLNDIQDSLNKDLQRISIDIAMLNVKSGIWGIMGGLVPVAVMILMSMVGKK